MPKTTRRAPWPHSGPFREEPISDVVRIKVTVLEIIPPIWRRIQVPVHLTLRRLHTVLQETIGWKDVHPHRFCVGDIWFGKPSDAAGRLKDSRWVSIEDLLYSGTKTFTYQYGSSGGWTHEVRIESRTEGNPENQRPICLGGERACPPEDSGGPDDYVDRVLARPGFDPEHFDLAEVNATLSGLRRANQIP